MHSVKICFSVNETGETKRPGGKKNRRTETKIKLRHAMVMSAIGSVFEVLNQD